MSTGPSVCRTASRWMGFSASSSGEVASVSVATSFSLGAAGDPFPGNLLGQLHDEPVGVREVDAPMSPRMIDRPGQEPDAGPAEPVGPGVDVLHQEQELPAGAARGGLPAQEPSKR